MAYLGRSATARSPVPDAAPETWARIRSVGEFALCDSADLIRIFPRLLPRDGIVPAAIRAQLARCLAVLAWRSATRRDGAVLRLLRDVPGLALADLLTLGRREHRRWFPGGGPPAARTAGAVDDLVCLVLVEKLHREIAAAALRRFEPEAAALLAYAAGIHPAYLWEEALLSHERFTAIGWLGQLRRAGRARVPADVADYLDDVIDRAADGTPQVRDPDLAAFLPSAILGEMQDAVLTRRQGLEASVSWSVAASTIGDAQAEVGGGRA